MDIKHLEILKTLNAAGGNVPADISPLLLTWFPHIDRMNSFEVRFGTSMIFKLLEDMKAQNWIDVSQYTPLGSGNDSNGYTWIDTVHINASIKAKGIEALETELKKGDAERLTDSILALNQSTMDTNLATQANYIFQKRVQTVSLIIGGASALFILITIIQSIADKTPQRLQDMQKVMKTQDTTLQKIGTYLQKISDSIQPVKIDTVYVRTTP